MRKILSLCVVALLSASMWATNTYKITGSNGKLTGWGTWQDMSVSEDGLYEYFAVNGDCRCKISPTDTYADAMGEGNNQAGFNSTDVTDTWSNDGNVNYYYDGDYYILIYYAGTTINSTQSPIICASTTLPEQPEDVTLYFVNTDNWTPIQAYVFVAGSSNSYKTWPGEAMTEVDGVTVNGHKVYSYTFPETFTRIIFNDKVGDEGSQTADLAWNTDKPYFYPERLNGSNQYETKWYTYATLPGETTVYFVNSKGWSFANAYAYKISQDVNDYAKAWPGLSMTKTEQKVNDYDIYKVSFSSYFNGVIFNNKIGDSGEQLERFVTDAAKPYYYEGTLYASIEDILATTTSVEHTYDDVQCTKLLRNGQILILRGEKVYTVTGQEVR